MKFHSLFPFMFAFTVILAACGSSTPTASPNTSSPTNTAVSAVSNTDNPSDAAKGFFDALYSGAATDQFICTGNATVTDGLKQMGVAISAGILSGGVKIDTSGLTYTTANQTADSADVTISGKVKSLSLAGSSNETDFPTQVLVMKNDNGWKVCGMGSAKQ